MRGTLSCSSLIDGRGPSGQNIMNIATIFDLCTPRGDVLKGTSSDSDFAADLSHVIRGSGGPREYSDPALFFSNTYPTRGLKSLLANVGIRLTGQSGAV